MKYNFYLFFCVILMVSCSRVQPRRPKQYRSVTYFYKDLIQQNKRLNVREENFLKQVIKKDTSHNYLSSLSGFWYAYKVKKSTENNNKPKSTDIVDIKFQINDVYGNEIYPIQEKTLRLDKEEFVPALHDGIKLMNTGETIIFVIPSYRAYGVVGDGNKIGGNQPINCIVTLLNFKNNNNEEN